MHRLALGQTRRQGDREQAIAGQRDQAAVSGARATRAGIRFTSPMKSATVWLAGRA